VILFGSGRAAIANDPDTAERLGWSRRRPSLPEPEIVLHPRFGDGYREPWITPPGWRPSRGPSALWGEGAPRGRWEFLAGVPGAARYVAHLAEPPVRRWRVAVAGLGKVGGTAAAVLAAMPTVRSGIAELLLYDADAANLERWHAELQAVTEWRRDNGFPTVRQVGLSEVFHRCDLLLFAATAGVPPLGSEGDVRYLQFGPNREILANYLREADHAGFCGLLLIVSDPVECLALAAFADSNADATGRFAGHGLAPERIGGLALGVMWGRALARARRHGWQTVARRGAAFGPHGIEVVVFDDLQDPDTERCELLSAAARSGNLELRELGFLPYVGPALSSVALVLPRLLAGREAPASVFLDGVYFGAPARLRWGLVPAAHRMAPAVRGALGDVYETLRNRAEAYGLTGGGASA
jgi:hypothetical protein